MRRVDDASSVRHRTEDLERASLSSWAALASETKGRDRYESADGLRTAFQQDRDRLLHADAFAALAGKARVHGMPAAGSALTHTLEVCQVARTIGRALRLNEDLIEAVSLGHDLGWPPFGAAGEEALSACLSSPFRHAEQGLRAVETLERAGTGLNLTWEVRDGIVNHDESMPEPATLEARVVRLADGIAGVTAALEAARRSDVVGDDDVPRAVDGVLGATREAQVGALIADVVRTSEDRPEAGHSERVAALLAELDAVLRARIAGVWDLRVEQARAVHCLRSLAVLHAENPETLPAPGRSETLPAPGRSETPLEVRVVDQLAGLTDEQAARSFAAHFTPRVGG
jgi:dGTPase